MPTYTMRNLETDEVRDMIMSLKEREDLLATGKFKQELATPGFVSMTGGTLSKTSGDWKNLMTKIKKQAGRGNTVKD